VDRAVTPDSVEENPVKVLVADNSVLVRERLVALVSEVEAIDLVGQAGNAGETIGCVDRLSPDVVILDSRTIDRNGLQVLKKIKAGQAAPVVIVLSTDPYPQYREMCRRLGADFFLDKDTEFDRVNKVLVTLGNGHSTPYPRGQYPSQRSSEE
jgi:DNA-binding NarL/FixJ family response regulator